MALTVNGVNRLRETSFKRGENGVSDAGIMLKMSYRYVSRLTQIQLLLPSDVLDVTKVMPFFEGPTSSLKPMVTIFFIQQLLMMHAIRLLYQMQGCRNRLGTGARADPIF